MRKLVSIACLSFAWLCANGALLDIVQVFAWARMFAGYNETMTVGAALRETFDPAKACELCVGVAQAKDTADHPLPALPEKNSDPKLVLACDTPAAVVLAAPARDWPRAFASAGPSRCEAVPVPPPRV